MPYAAFRLNVTAINGLPGGTAMITILPGSSQSVTSCGPT